MMQAVGAVEGADHRLALRRPRADQSQPQHGRRAAAGAEEERRRGPDRGVRHYVKRSSLRPAARPAAPDAVAAAPATVQAAPHAVPDRGSRRAADVPALRTRHGQGLRRSHRLRGEVDRHRSRRHLVRLRRRRRHRRLEQRGRDVQRDAGAGAPRLQRGAHRKLWSGNLLRVWREVEKVAKTSTVGGSNEGSRCAALVRVAPAWCCRLPCRGRPRTGARQAGDGDRAAAGRRGRRSRCCGKVAMPSTPPSRSASR